MWDLEDRLRDALADDAEHVMPHPEGLARIREDVACQYEAQERLAVGLGIAYGPAPARRMLRAAAFCALAARKHTLADFWSATADLLTDGKEPSTATDEGSTTTTERPSS